MARIDTDSMISITEANRLGISKLAAEASEGSERVLVRNNTAIAAVVGIDTLDELDAIREDMTDLMVLSARMLTDSGGRTSLDSVLESFGLTRDELLDD